MQNDEHVLWEANGVSCVMVSCCSGAELQVRRGERGEYDILLRELYPMKSDAYERARGLALEYAALTGLLPEAASDR